MIANPHETVGKEKQHPFPFLVSVRGHMLQVQAFCRWRQNGLFIHLVIYLFTHWMSLYLRLVDTIGKGAFVPK